VSDPEPDATVGQADGGGVVQIVETTTITILATGCINKNIKSKWHIFLSQRLPYFLMSDLVFFFIHSQT